MKARALRLPAGHLSVASVALECNDAKEPAEGSDAPARFAGEHFQKINELLG